MIARGDLAVEVGYERLAEFQEEILWLCEAAHLPVIWATEVLDQLARTGQPSRAEVTDAAMAQRAECVMLNKGPHVDTAIVVLDDILRRMSGHQRKKTALLRPLRSWDEPAPDSDGRRPTAGRSSISRFDRLTVMTRPGARPRRSGWRPACVPTGGPPGAARASRGRAAGSTTRPSTLPISPSVACTASPRRTPTSPGGSMSRVTIALASRRARGRPRPPGRSRASSRPRARRSRRSRCHRGGSRSPRQGQLVELGEGAAEADVAVAAPRPCRAERGGPRPLRCSGSTTRWVSSRATGSTTTLLTVAAGPVAAHGGGPDRERGVCHTGLLCRARPYRGAGAVRASATGSARHQPRRSTSQRSTHLVAVDDVRGARGRPRSGRRGRAAPGCGRRPGAASPGRRSGARRSRTTPRAPSTDGLPWSMPSALSPQSATAQPAGDRDHRGQD